MINVIARRALIPTKQSPHKFGDCHAAFGSSQ
jgi:hypothetical protein